MEHEAFVTTVMAVMALLFLAAVSAVITKRVRFPYTVGLVVIGVAVAFIADDYPDLAHALDQLKLEPVMIMFLFIPILIFESAFNTDVPLLMRNLVPALTLAGPGLLLSTALIGILLHLLLPLPLESALIFGCLISATDPVAVIALARSLPKHFSFRWQIINFAFGVTLFMLLTNGTTMSWLVRRLGLSKPSPSLEYLGTSPPPTPKMSRTASAIICSWRKWRPDACTC